MSAASSPNPNNLILLAVLGIGAYWVFSRQAMAQPYAAARPAGSNTANNLSGAAQLLNAGGNLLKGLFGGSAAPRVNTNTAYYSGQLTPGQYNTAAGAARADSDPDLNGSYADWVRNDGAAYNPPGNTSAWDAAWQADYNNMVGL